MGAALARTGLDRRTPLAAATLVIAANAPDVDVLAYARGEYSALAFRRGITHGLPAQALLPFLVAGGVLAWDRWVRRRRRPEAEAAVPGQILLLSAVGVLTHPLLDWLNVYGMRWGLPFDGAWSYGDALFIVDPWLWLALGGAAFVSGAGGRVLWSLLALPAAALVVLGPVPPAAAALWLGGACAALLLRRSGRPRDEPGRRRAARLGVALSVAYIALMWAAGATGTRSVMAAARAAGLEPSEAMLSPVAANPFVAEVEVVTPAGYVPGERRWLLRPGITLRAGDAVPLVLHPQLSADSAAALLQASRSVPDARHYLAWSRYPYAVVTREGGEWLVRWSDARYDDRGGAGGLAGVTVRVPPAR